ncbi:hypothetical protein niasHT_022032 [Heterodera trifolii]|uniref:Astacin domain-containing protein n=1 Tax=Heterodera trifolii TaxID=157864 RepID=A0ABD2JBG5_9BILA
MHQIKSKFLFFFFAIFLFSCAFVAVVESGFLKQSLEVKDGRIFVQKPTFVQQDRNIIRIERDVPFGDNATVRASNHDVYLWPSLDDREKELIRSAFEQIHRRTCLRFNELDYKPWYHAERWSEGKPYILIRKSKKFSGYSDNNIENVNRRSLIYLSEKSFSTEHNVNTSRGLIMEQLVKFMGFREEFLRADASSYIQPINANKRPPGPSSPPVFSNEQLMWPFDPESITIPATAREWFKLSVYCKGRQNSDIGAAQRAGILTRWDAVKLNSMFCPDQVGNADPRMGPCVVPRKQRNSNPGNN